MLVTKVVTVTALTTKHRLGSLRLQEVLMVFISGEGGYEGVYFASCAVFERFLIPAFSPMDGSWCSVLSSGWLCHANQASL